MNSLGGGVNPQTLDGGDDYHFKFKIALVGDSSVGKSAFLDAISQTLGTVVENEHSSELHIKVSINSTILLITVYILDDILR